MEAHDSVREEQIPHSLYSDYAIARLEELNRRREMIEAKREKFEFLESRKYDIGAPAPTGMPHNPPRTRSPMAEAICTQIPLSAELDRAERIYVQMLAHVCALIDSLEDARLQTILYQRDLKNLSWPSISKKHRYSKRWCVQLHSKALEKLGKLMVEHNTHEVFVKILEKCT